MAKFALCLGIPFLVLLLAAVVVVLVVQSRKPGFLSKLFPAKVAAGGLAEALPYEARGYFFSWAENSFYQTLRQAVGDRYVIFAKVRLADIIEVPKGTNNWQRHRNRIQSKHLDFLLCDPKDFRPAVAIELDDSSHDRPDRAERDDFLNAALGAAGLPCLRIPAVRGYSPAELRQDDRRGRRVRQVSSPRHPAGVPRSTACVQARTLHCLQAAARIGLTRR